MRRSRIILKCKCSDECKLLPSFLYGGYHYSHAPEEIKLAVGTQRKVSIKRANYNKGVSVKLRKEKRSNDPVVAELELWFLLGMNTFPMICENCGKYLDHYTAWEWRGSNHHIIEKHLCPSVQSNQFNRAIIGYYCCHGQCHTSSLNLTKMPVFPILKERFLLFHDKIADHERVNIPECFLIN